VTLAPYLVALGVTLAIEVPVVAAVFAGQRRRMAMVALLTTTTTHLLMHFLLPHYTHHPDQWLLWGEVGALAVEAIAYGLLSRPRDPGRGLLASGVANGLSFGAGVVLVRWGLLG
jgi:hypothetical protein